MDHQLFSQPDQQSSDLLNSSDVYASLFRDMAQMSARSFRSSQEAIRAALPLLSRFLNCQTLFVARFDIHHVEEKSATSGSCPPKQLLRILETHHQGTSPLVAGSERLLEETYCQTIWRTHRPLIIDDVMHNPYYRQLPVTRDYNIGSYIGVPLLYSDGRLYGTLCSQDSRPQPLTRQPEKLEIMHMIAHFLISHIEREEFMHRLRAAERSQAELVYREQQARLEVDQRVQELEAIFEAIGDGIVVSDRDGQLCMNDIARDLLAMPLPNQSMYELFAQHQKQTLIWDEKGQQLPYEQLPFVRVLRGEHLTGEKALLIERKNPRGERRFLSVSGRPIRDQHNHITGSVLIYHDIHDRYLLTRRTHAMFDALLQFTEKVSQLPKSTVLDDADTSVSFQLSSFHLTYQCLKHLISTIVPGQDVGILSLNTEKGLWHLIHEDNSVKIQEAGLWQDVQRVFASFHEADIRHLNANEIVVHELPSREYGAKSLMIEAPMFVRGHLLGALVLISPQLEHLQMTPDDALIKAVAKMSGLVYEHERLFLQRAEDRANGLALQETNRRFNEFLSIASHELKGPLTSLKGNIQLAQRVLHTLVSQQNQGQEIPFPLLEKMQRYLKRADQQINIQSRLASDLLDVSRIRAGTLALHRQPCDIGQVVREIVEDQRLVMPDRTILLHQPAETLMITADAERVGQVVTNFLTNAHKYSALDRPITVVLTTEGTMVRVTVSDQGPGLDPDEQQYIWERFYRVKGISVINGNGHGLGLGLHICKMIVEQHGGRVGLRSTPGEGSHFWLDLPLQ